MVSIFSFKELYVYYYYIWLYMYTVVLLYTEGVPWLWKVEPSTNLLISVADIQMFGVQMWVVDVVSLTSLGQFSTQFVWLELPVLVPVSMFRTGPRNFEKNDDLGTGG